MNGYPAYEAHGHRDNGEVFDVAVLGRLPDTDAFARAQQYANLWRVIRPFERTGMTCD
jgi:hypothetical protein